MRTLAAIVAVGVLAGVTQQSLTAGTMTVLR